MARVTNIKLRRSATAGAVPTTSAIDLGEIALNTYDGKAYMKKDVGGTTSVVEIGSSAATASDILKEYQYDGSDGASSNTVFSGSDNNSNTLTYVVGALNVFLNGVLLQPTVDYTAANTSSITLINAASDADLLQIIAWFKSIGTGSDAVQQFTGHNGSQTAFTLSTDPKDENQTSIFIDGVYQNKTTYAISGTTLTFSAAPPSGTEVEVVTHTSNIVVTDVDDLTISGTMTANAFAGALTGNVTGNVTGTVSSLSNLSTSNLSEGSNLYYTNARADARITAADTDDLSEGSSNLYHTSERVDDRVNTLIVAGSNITKTYDDAAGTLTLASTQLTTEQVQDVVGAMFTSNTETRGSLTYDDGDGTIDLVVDDMTANTQLSTEAVQDIVGAMFTSNTETRIGATYEDGDGTIDLVVDDMTANTTYSAGTGLALSTTTFSLSHLGLESLTDPDADRIFFWDDSASAAKFLSLGTGLSISGTVLSGSALYADSDARAAISVTDSGGDGSLAYNNSTGVITYTGPSAAEVRAHLSAGTGMTFSGGAFATSITQYTTALARATISVTDAGGDGSLAYNNSTGVITYTGPSAAEVRAHVSVTDSGGDGSLAYNSSTGVITYTGPSAAEVRAHISAGTGVAISSGAISIGQAVATSSDVTFNDLTVSGDFTVNGDTTTVNTATLSVEDPLIIMASGNNSADAVDIGFYGLYDTSGSQDLYSGLFRDASDSGKWKLFKDNQAAPTTTVNTSGTGYATGTLVSNLEGNVTGNVTGNTSGTSGSTTGNAATATALQNARTIGGTSFDGTANIAVALAGTATTLATARTIGGTSFDGSANIAVALASTATTLATARTIGGTSFDGSANIAVALAGTATTLATARTIGGTSFDGSADIAVALSATATALASARTIGGVSFDGTANINLPGVNASGTQDTSGNAATATALATARTIGGTSFDGTANIAVATATEATNVTAAANNSTDETVYPTFVDGATGTQGIETDTGLTYNPSSGTLTSTVLVGALTGNVTGNTSGTAATVTTAAQTAITSLGSLTGLDVNGAVTINDNLSLDGSNKELRFYEGANYVGFEAPALSADQIWVLPSADGSNGTALKTDGSGNLSWGTAGGNAFETIAVSGQSNVVADSTTDTLTFAAGTGITLTTNAGSDTVTITNSATGDNAFKTISVSGQSDVVADATDDTLTLVGGDGVTITTAAGTDTITISSLEGVNPFKTDLYTTANSSTTQYTVSQTPADEDALMVFIEGVYQNKNSYVLSGTTVTLDTAPASGQEVVIHTIATGVTGTGHNSDQFTANGSTAAYTLSVNPVTEDNCFVFFDGVYQNKSTFSTSGTTITFDANVTASTAIEVITPTITAVNVPVDDSVSPAKLSTGGPTWNTDGQVTIDSDLSIGMTTTSCSTGSATTICTLAGATYRSAKLEISIKDATASEYESTEVLMVHNGSTTSITEYGQIFTGSAALGTISATYSSSNVLIQYTPTGSNTHVVKVKHSAIKV